MNDLGLNERSQTKKKKYTLYDSIYIKFLKDGKKSMTESRSVVAWSGEGRKGNWERLQKSVRVLWGWWIISLLCIFNVVMASRVRTYQNLTIPLNMCSLLCVSYSSVKKKTF